MLHVQPSLWRRGALKKKKPLSLSKKRHVAVLPPGWLGLQVSRARPSIFPIMRPPQDTHYLPFASFLGVQVFPSIPFLVLIRGILQATSPPTRWVRSLVHVARQPPLRRCWRVLALASRLQPAPQSLRRRLPRLRRLSRFRGRMAPCARGALRATPSGQHSAALTAARPRDRRQAKPWPMFLSIPTAWKVAWDSPCRV